MRTKMRRANTGRRTFLHTSAAGSIGLAISAEEAAGQATSPNCQIEKVANSNNFLARTVLRVVSPGEDQRWERGLVSSRRLCSAVKRFSSSISGAG